MNYITSTRRCGNHCGCSRAPGSVGGHSSSIMDTTKVLDWVRLLRMNNRLTKICKYLTFILKHHPEKIGLKLDAEGWANVDELVTKANSNGKTISPQQVQDVVALDEKKMFDLSEDGLRVRANS